MTDTGLRAGMTSEYARTITTWKEVGSTPFRKGLIAWAMEQYDCTLESAASTYATVKNKFAAAHPELKEVLEGLGRAPEKNNGGRKKKVVVEGEAVVTDLTAPVEEVLAAVVEEAPKLFTVFRKSDNVVVAEGLAFFDAQNMIAKAKSGKKAALYAA